MIKNWEDYKKQEKASGRKNEIAEVETISKVISAILEKREQLGYSQRDLAKLAGLPQSTIARFETKFVTPNLETLLKIMKPLGLTIQIVNG